MKIKETLTALLLAGSASAGCATMPKPGFWPAIGNYICVVNPTLDEVRLSVVDGIGRELDKGIISPGKRIRFLWPYIHEVGFFRTRSRNGWVVQSQSFNPWEHSWGYSVGSDSLTDYASCQRTYQDLQN